MKKATFLVASALGLMSFLGGDMIAATVTSSQSGNWNSTSTWGGSPVPGAGDVVIITGNFTVTLDVANAACSTIQLGGTASGAGDGTLTFNSGTQLAVGGVVTVGAANNKGSINMAAGGTLICQGFINNGVGTWTPGTGTVELAASNTLPNNGITSFNNLTIAGGTTGQGANLDVTGNLVIAATAVLSSGASTLTVGGNWSNSGTFTAGPGVTFNSALALTLTSTGGDTFNNLVLNTPGGMRFNSSVTVNGTFSFSSGVLTFAGTALTLNGPVTGSGRITSGVAGTLVVYNQGADGQNVLNGTYDALTFNNFNKILPSTGVIGIVSTFSPGTATGHTVAGSKFDFVGAAQVLPAFPFNNINLSGVGTKTGPGNFTVGGNLTISPGVAYSGADTLTLNGTASVNAGTLTVPTISLGPAGALLNVGTVNVDSALTGPGSFTQGASGVLNIKKTVDVASFTVSAGGNTVNYAGAGQTLRPAVYHHLTISGSGSPVLTGVDSVNGNFTLAGTINASAATGLTIGGNFTIGAVASFDAGSFSHSVGGNFANSGSFSAGTSTLTMKGTGAQTMTGPAFNILAVNNGTGVSMLGDVSVASSLTLTAGPLSIGPHTLTLNGTLAVGAGSLTGGASSNIVVGGSGAGIALPGVELHTLSLNRSTASSISADVLIDSVLTVANGSLNTGASTLILAPAGSLSEVPGHTVVGNVFIQRNIAATAGTVTFGNIGADLVLGGVAPGITSVHRTTGTASTGTGHSSIRRFFAITPATNANLAAGLVFHYDSTEVAGQNPAAFELYRSRDAGTTWNNEGGTVNTASRTVSISGINDFSLWTVSDTSNRIGLTTAPATASIVPASGSAGGASFTLTVNGTNFVNGKSTIRFNGSDRTTTYVSTTQLKATIPASDLLALGSFPVAVFNAAGGGLSNAQTFVVNPGAAASVIVETAANGSGTVVPVDSINAGATVTVYAITRDGLGNFVANVAASSWSLQNITGGVTAGDLVPSVDGKSAVFTAHALGSANIQATFGSLTAIVSGKIVVKSLTGITAAESAPLTYALMQNFPNPFNPTTQINFDLPFEGQVSLVVYDLIGREVATLAAGFHTAGHHSVTWDASHQASGVYFYRLRAGDSASGQNFVAVKRLVLLK